LQFGVLGVQGQQGAAAHGAAEAADPQLVAGLGAMHFMQVLQAPALEHGAIVRDEVGVFQQQQVHCRGAGGWSSEPSSASTSPRLRTRPPKNRPTSNSSHIGTASRVWEKMSGGVRIMPTTKQPTMT